MNTGDERKKPEKKGQIVKFHSPLADEDPNQLYTVQEVVDDSDKPRSSIEPLSTGLTFPSVITVSYLLGKYNSILSYSTNNVSIYFSFQAMELV